MNSDTLQGKLKQFSGAVKAKWGELTDDEITEAQGDTEKLAGKIQEKYGLARDKAKDSLDDLKNKI